MFQYHRRQSNEQTYSLPALDKRLMVDAMIKSSAEEVKPELFMTELCSQSCKLV